MYMVIHISDYFEMKAMIIVSATSAPVFWQVHEKLFKFSLLSDTTDRSMILLAETMIMAEMKLNH